MNRKLSPVFNQTVKMETTTFSEISAEQSTDTQCGIPRTGSALKMNHREILDLL